jgi:excisionase family DNA binding protein
MSTTVERVQTRRDVIPEKLLTYRDVSEITGMPEASIRRLVMNGKLSCFKFGKSVRFSREQIFDANLHEAQR